MAARVVIVGPNYNGRAPCIEINADDASAFVSGANPMLAVSVSKYAGPLADATVLSWSQDYLRMLADEHNEPGDNDLADLWWARVEGALRHVHRKREFSVDCPIPMGEIVTG